VFLAVKDNSVRKARCFRSVGEKSKKEEGEEAKEKGEGERLES